MKLFKTIYRPILTFGETWVINESLKSKIRIIEIKYMRTVMTVTKRIELKMWILDLSQLCNQHRYLQRKDSGIGGATNGRDKNREKNLENKAVSCDGKKNRKRGRPKQPWGQQIAEILEKDGI